MDIPEAKTKRVIRVKAPPKGQCTEIKVTGHRDPRGPDNSIFVWVDDKDRLHIRTFKADRCYKFSELQVDGCIVEVIAD